MLETDEPYVSLPWSLSSLSLASHCFSLFFLFSNFAWLCKEYNRVLDEQEEAKAKELSERSSAAMCPSRLFCAQTR